MIADEAMPLAGNIAFRSIFSLFPFLIFLTAIAGFFGNEQLAERAVNFLLVAVPEQVAKPLAGEIRSILTVPRADLVSVAALLTIWSAMGGIDSVRVGLNRAYDMKETRSSLVLYVLNTVFVIAAAVMLMIFSFLIIIFPIMLEQIDRFVPHTSERFATYLHFRYPVTLLLLFVGLYVAHRFLPAKPLPARRILPGVMATLVVLTLLSAIFTQWLLRFNTFSTTYNSLGGLFAAMFFIYLAALALILGGEVNRVLDIQRNRIRAGRPKTGQIEEHPDSRPVLTE